MNKTFLPQISNAISSHLSPHQFGVVIKGRCEIMLKRIWATLKDHLDWVVLQVDVANAFNIIFQELHATSE